MHNIYLDLYREQAAWGDEWYDARRCALRRKYVILHGTKDTGYQIFPRTYTYRPSSVARNFWLIARRCEDGMWACQHDKKSYILSWKDTEIPVTKLCTLGRVLPQTSSPAFWHSYHRREDDGWSETWTWSNMVLPLVWNQPVTLSIGISVHQWWCRKRLRVETENRHVYKQSPQIPKQIYIKNARDGKPKCLLAFLIINDHPVKSISKLLGNVDIYA